MIIQFLENGIRRYTGDANIFQGSAAATQHAADLRELATELRRIRSYISGKPLWFNLDLLGWTRNAESKNLKDMTLRQLFNDNDIPKDDNKIMIDKLYAFDPREPVTVQPPEPGPVTVPPPEDPPTYAETASSLQQNQEGGRRKSRKSRKSRKRKSRR